MLQAIAQAAFKMAVTNEGLVIVVRHKQATIISFVFMRFLCFKFVFGRTSCNIHIIVSTGIIADI